MIPILAIVSVIGFVGCFAGALWLALIESNFGASAGFALLASWWFIIMVISSVAFTRGKN